MLAIRELLLRAFRIFGRLVGWCAVVMVSLLAAGRGGGSPGVARSDSSSIATVTINAAEHYQRIAGFGVSEGFGQAKTLMSAPASVQKRVLSLLYSPTRWGIDAMRAGNPFAASRRTHASPIPLAPPVTSATWVRARRIAESRRFQHH